MKTWMNGAIIDEAEAMIPVQDHGFLYGMGLFETFRTYDGQPFLLAQHLDRLFASCDELKIPCPIQLQPLTDAVKQLLRINKLADAYFRLTISAGIAPLGLPGARGYDRPNVILMVKELPLPLNSSRPLALLALRRNSPEGPMRRKSAHYMNNILAKWELADRPLPPSVEGIFINQQGQLTEGIVSNLFFTHSGILYTPALETGCLPGVTRNAVLELAMQLDIPTEIGYYSWDNLCSANEVFMTNSIQGITPIDVLYDLNDQVVKQWHSLPGLFTFKLTAAYAEWTRSKA
jgi:4-amino-4-deoxychorismate lyase